jgi:hypothetical protein
LLLGNSLLLRRTGHVLLRQIGDTPLKRNGRILLGRNTPFCFNEAAELSFTETTELSPASARHRDRVDPSPNLGSSAWPRASHHLRGERSCCHRRTSPDPSDSSC